MKTRRILAILFAVMLIAAAVPIASAAEVVTEEDRDFSPLGYRYTVKSEYVLEGSNPRQVVGSSTIKDNVWLWVYESKDVLVTPSAPSGYELVDNTPETVNISYPGLGKKLKATVTFYVREPAPETYNYKVYVQYVLEGSGEPITLPIPVGSGTLNVGATTEVYVPLSLPHPDYELVSSTAETVPVSQPDGGGDFEKTVTYIVRLAGSSPQEYGYTVNYVFYLGTELTTAVSHASADGSAPVGALDLTPHDIGDQTDDDGNVYKLESSLEATIVEEGTNSFTLVYRATTGGQTTPDVTPVYIPPQVLIPATPTPEPEIELPEEEIPTDVPDETTEIEEEEELFEDEEIPTDVPATGDASAIIPAIALLALAGAAFALTFKKSRNDG